MNLFLNLCQTETKKLNPDYLSNAGKIFSFANFNQAKISDNYIEFPQRANNFDFFDIGIQQCSAVDDDLWNNIRGIIEDILDGNSKDGEIGDTQQGATGDCWLLSGVNALSYTEEGKKAISEALEDKNGYTIVHTACGDYVVSDKEVRLTKANAQYSDGDDDMIILELAVEKILDDIANGNLKFDESVSEILNNTFLGNQATTTGKSSASGGNAAGLIYLLTGKIAQRHISKEEIALSIDKFEQNNNKDMTITCGFKKNQDENGKTTSHVVKDVYGNEVTLITAHAFAVKSVDNNTVTIVNPHNSAEEIILNKETFLKYCSDVEVCDLSSNNPEQDLFTPKMYYNKNGDIEKTVETDDNGNVIQYFYNYNKKGELTDINYDAQYKDGRYVKVTWDSEGNRTYAENGNKDTKITLIRYFDEDGNVKDTKLGEVDSSGKLKYSFVEMTPDIAERILDADLLRYESLSAQNIFSLAKNLTDSEFDKAVEYLQKNPNATYNEVLRNIK